MEEGEMDIDQERERERGRDYPFAGSLPKHQQNPGLRLKPKN